MGYVDTITVVNGGTGYTSTPTVTIGGAGTGATATHHERTEGAEIRSLQFGYSRRVYYQGKVPG